MKKWIAAAVALTLGFTLGTAKAASPSPLSFESFGRYIVKIESRLCDSNDHPFRGSGTLFQYLGGVYVLTSDHVVLHDNGKYCHFVTNTTLGEKPLKASLRAYDWGKGLALLEVTDVLPLAFAMDLPTRNAFAANPAGEVSAAGYPFSVSQLLMSKAEVLIPESRRHEYPSLETVMEVETHGEYGMSGGPILSRDSQSGAVQIAGVLSSRFLVPTLGGPEQMGEFSYQDSRVVNHLTAVRSADIIHWLNLYFADPTHFQPTFTRSVSAQLEDRSEVTSGGLTFTVISPSPTGPSPVGGGDGPGKGHGIGGDGRDGEAIIQRKGGGDGPGKGKAKGGGDGAGIGGDAPEHPSITVEVTLASSTSPQSEWYLPEMQALHDAIIARLLKRTTIRVSYFKRLELGTKNIEKLYFTSLGDFLTRFRDGWLWPDMNFHNQLMDASSDKLREDAATQAQSLLKQTAALRPALGSEDTPGIHLLDQLDIALNLIADGNPEGTEVRLAQLSSRNEPGWTELFSPKVDKFAESVDLLKGVIQLKTLVDRIAM